MRQVHFEHWWISHSEVLALNALRASLEAQDVLLIDDLAPSDASAVLMSAQRVWEGVCGNGARPIDLAPYLSAFDLESRIFAPFRAVDAPSHVSLYGIPLGAFRNNLMWVNRRVAERAGGPPQGIEGWPGWLERASRQLPNPLGLGREDWQASLLFEVIVLAMHGGDFHRRAFGARSLAAIESPRMLESLRLVRELRSFVAPQHTAPAWHGAVAACQAGGCAAVVMGDWVHGEFRRRAGASPCESVSKWVVPGTGASFLYNVDYIVPIERKDRPTDPELLYTLTHTLLDPHVQCSFGMVKGSLPTVRDAQEANIDPESWKMFHLAMLCPDILIPSMSLLQGSPRSMRAAVAAAVREVLYGDGSVQSAHALLLRRSNSTLPVSIIDGHQAATIEP
jgi:ABC-type glycerol-3-phosphate transport system substrate-binding protein